MIAVLISAILAVLTLRLVEDPMRFATSIRKSATRSLTLGAAATAVAVGTGLVLLSVIPAPVGRGPALAAPTVTSSEITSAFAQAQALIADSVGMTAVPSNLDPSLTDAAG
jgi:hypothetical protein